MDKGMFEVINKSSVDFLPITKVQEELREVTGEVSIPEETDLQHDIYGKTAIRKAMIEFMRDYQTLGEMHKGLARDSFIMEIWQTRKDDTVAGRFIKEGTVMMTTKIEDDGLWNDIKSGKITGYSWGGYAREGDV